MEEEQSKDLQEYPVQPSQEELPKSPSNPDWIYPKDFDINAKVENLDDTMLGRYHSLAHIYWNKVLNGAELNFTLDELIILHFKIIREFEKRNQIHFKPINSLDEVWISNLEFMHYVQNLQKNSEEIVKKSEANLSFFQPTVTKRNPTEEA